MLLMAADVRVISRTARDMPAQPAPGHLCFQRPILLPKEGDHIAFLALEPSKRRREEDLEWNTG